MSGGTRPRLSARRERALRPLSAHQLLARPALRRRLGLVDRRRGRLRRAADDRLLPRLDPLAADELPGEPAHHPLHLCLQPRPPKRIGGNRRGGGAGAGRSGDPLDLRQRLRRALARPGDHDRRPVGDVALARAAPPLRDGRRAGALPGLRRSRALLRRTARGDDRRRLEVDEPDVGGVPLDLRPRQPLGRRPGARGRGQPALRPARLQALGRPRVRRARTLRRQRHRLQRFRPRIRAGQAAVVEPKPRRHAGASPGERDRGRGGRQGLRQQRQQVRIALPALRPRQRRTKRRVRSAERRRLLRASRSRPDQGGLPPRGRRQARHRRDGGGWPVPAAGARLRPLRWRARRGPAPGLACGRDHPRPGTAALAVGLRAGGARRRGDPRPRPRLLQRLAGEARRLPTAQGGLLADPGDPARGQRGAGECDHRARLADVVRPAVPLLLGRLRPA